MMMNIQEHFFDELVICPSIGHQVPAEQITFQGISGRMAGVDVWWRCPACGHWHFFNLEPQQNRKAEDERKPACC